MSKNVKSRRKREINIELDSDLYNYIAFLEKIKRVKKKEEAAVIALRIFKKLNLQDWYPNVYRSGQERILMISQGMIRDLFSSFSEPQLTKLSRMIARNRITLDTFDTRLDLDDPENWDVILKEMENYGWGSFTQKNGDIRVEQLGLPISFIKNYLETLFKTRFNIEALNDEKIYILKKDRSRKEKSDRLAKIDYQERVS
jgi:hypothetical protein